MPKTTCGCVLIAAAVLFVYESPAQDGYRLVWSDEFDTPGLPDPSSWGYEHGFVRNQELQWYQPQNAVCEEGLLVIEARQERVENARQNGRWSPGWARDRAFAEYTSASLNTRGKHAWQYGRFLVRAKVDGQPGMWPAIWFLGVKRPWPACGEIDLMECYQQTILANAAWQGPRQTAWDDSRTPLSELGDASWTDSFHVWRMDWTPEKIELFVDDRLLNTIDLAKTLNPDGSNPFHQPHYLLLNLAVGGTQGGDPSRATLPARYCVDYVRVYAADPASPAGDG